MVQKCVYDCGGEWKSIKEPHAYHTHFSFGFNQFCTFCPLPLFFSFFFSYENIYRQDGPLYIWLF